LLLKIPEIKLSKETVMLGASIYGQDPQKSAQNSSNNLEQRAFF